MRREMTSKTLWRLWAPMPSILAASLMLCACGSTSKPPAREAPIKAVVRSAAAGGEANPRSETDRQAGVPARKGAYLNDGDKEPRTDEDSDDRNGNKVDEDRDGREDHEPTQNHSYHDSDDEPTLAFGHSAGSADRQAAARLIKRYYAVAANGDGKAACALMSRSFAASVPEDYGRPPAPPYLRGTTCEAVMSLLFAHIRHELQTAFVMTGLRVKGSQGVALLGSKTVMPASSIAIRREGGAWKIDALIGTPLA